MLIYYRNVHLLVVECFAVIGLEEEKIKEQI
jgi:hypothetical protein